MHKLNRPTEVDELTQARRAYTGSISQDDAWKNFGNSGGKKKVREQLESVQDDLCAYCEIALTGKTAIDHFKPKRINFVLTFDWDNLVLSCDEKGHVIIKKVVSFKTIG